MLKRVAILGATGSIGLQALEILSKYPQHFEIVALSTNTNTEILTMLVNKYRPSIVAIADENKANQFKTSMQGLKVGAGNDSLIELATLNNVDIILNAIVGIAGLKPTIAALEASKDVALANKESLVAAGKIVMETAYKNGSRLIPVDSEHSAIFQCLNPSNSNEIGKVYLTASGGPFRTLAKEFFKNVTPEQALNHPKWSMGKKISIDSATLMNKGLEVIEAKWLFDLTADQIEVLIHPQSIIHSMVEYFDGSIIAQIAATDMRLPILYALSYPKRLLSDLPKLNFFELAPFTFEKPDFCRFPCLSLAYEALRIGGTMPAVLNSANEIAVEKFLNRKISFEGIPALVRQAMDMHSVIQNPSICDILNADSEIRNVFGT